MHTPLWTLNVILTIINKEAREVESALAEYYAKVHSHHVLNVTGPTDSRLTM
jgi:hypothetical protein